MTHIGKLLKEAREKSGLSQGKIAKKLGHTSPQYVSNVERGECVCPIPMARIMARMLGLKKEQILEAMKKDMIEHFNEKWAV